ncbi:uncharacterized protein B0P05DRAFT_555333 [Gilbertella persicaria]|uniref:Leucine-rich repeat-containing protein 58 n=1 Tax=Rhizopus stolonifer TaxID=4846 RepID=A0A367KE65_RHIST|nr:uncharacterized protein B0P05DRAFT_555333 [Gilbertella persicaria]KAI8063692.1 hypothetical protein B0P05DRAFT_555333 [Gilbertella persicaria]RCI00400.1 hypothetical protein CU098_001863 [Rhizopus stolonifer]
MGQITSSYEETSVFAYLTNPLVDKSDTMKKDCIVLHPEFYGLKPSASIHSIKRIEGERPDSGFVSTSLDGNLQLLKDLAYIDQTYYDSNSTSSVKEYTITNIPKEDNGAYISFADAKLTSPDKMLREVYLSSRSIYSLSSNIGMLSMIKKLDLSNNHLTELPESIGYMQNLEHLTVSKNRITHLPHTIGYLSNLFELDVSYNQIQELTPFIIYLEKLKSLSLAHNLLDSLPTEISGLKNLIALDLSRNPLRILPAEVSQLPFLRRMKLEDCPLDTELVYPLQHNPVSLFETCARTIVRKQVKIDPTLPGHVVQYIQSAKFCTSCRGPYFDSYVLRGRWIEKADVQIPLQYTLCSAHWSDAEDRLLSIFSMQPETACQNTQLLCRPRLPSKPTTTTTAERLGSITRQTRHSALSPPSTIDSSVMADTLEDMIGDQSTSKQPIRHRFGKSNLVDWASKLRRH